MLTVPVEGTYRVVGIDPGTDTLGVVVLDVNLSTRQVQMIHVQTLRGNMGVRLHPGLVETEGERMAKLYSHYQSLLSLFNHYQPHAIMVEAPFMGRFPTAFEALVECRTFIRRAVAEYNPYFSIGLVDPPTAKLAVGVVPRKGVTKLDVKQGVLNLPNLHNYTPLPIIALDEHSIDAIAVAMVKVNQVLIFLGSGYVQSNL